MSLPRSTPSAQGVDAAGLRDFVVALESEGLAPHSLMLARHGQVVAEGWWHPYTAQRPALVYSLSKAVTATAVGLLVGEGRLGLDDPAQLMTFAVFKRSHDARKKTAIVLIYTVDCELPDEQAVPPYERSVSPVGFPPTGASRLGCYTTLRLGD